MLSKEKTMKVLNRLTYKSGREVRAVNAGAKIRLNRISASLFVLSMGIGVGALTPRPSVFAQSKEKTISLSFSREPQVAIVAPSVDGRTARFGAKFDAEQDWLRGTGFRIENTSGRTISYLVVNVLFPQTKTSNLGPMQYPIKFGNRPGGKLLTAAPLVLAPSEALNVTLDKDYPRMVKFVSQRLAIEDVREIELEIGFIVFDNGTAWAAGQFLRQDPQNPNLYLPLPRTDIK
jgi:hypothetical protein